MEPKSLENTLRENKIRQREIYLKKIKKQKKQDRIDNILFWFIFGAIALGVFVILAYSEQERGQAVATCMERHSANYCYKNI